MLTYALLGISLTMFIVYMSMIVFEKAVKKYGYQSRMSKIEDKYESLRQ